MNPPLDRVKSALERIPEVKLAAVFGSHATDRARPDSDLDLAIIAEPDVPEVWVRIEAEAGRAARTPVDVIRLPHAPPRLRFEIAKGKMLFEREPGAWTHFQARAMVDWWDWAPLARRMERAAVERLREKARHGSAHFVRELPRNPS